MNESLASPAITPPNLKPALSPKAHLSLTIAYTTLYGLLFLIIYVQLWMILYYKHRRLSYQTVFLSLCLLWAALRVTLFVFYFKNTTLANNLSTFWYWLLYCFPVCLQYITLCLLVVFFAQVVLRGRPKHERSRYKKPLWAAVAVVVTIFIGTNITCAVVIQRHKYDSNSQVQVAVSIIRVVVNGSLFIATAVCLSIAIVKMSKISLTSVVLEARGTTKLQATVTSVFIILLYSSRALYNIVAVSGQGHFVSFGFGWINVSDQADFLGLDQMNYAYVSFGIVLFVWELLPTFIVVMFFRVQKPKNVIGVEGLASPAEGPRGYFFDNPRRYDSDDDLARSPTDGYRDSNTPTHPAQLYTSSPGDSAFTPGNHSSLSPGDNSLQHEIQPHMYNGT